MNKRTFVVTFAAICIAFGIVLMVAAFIRSYNTDTPTTTTPTTIERLADSEHGTPREQLVAYRGHLLHCILLVTQFEGSRACDFQRYYFEHPELLRKKP